MASNSKIARFFQIHKVIRKDPDGSPNTVYAVTEWGADTFLYLTTSYEDCQRWIAEEA